MKISTGLFTEEHPIPSRNNYLRNLIEKAESVLKPMRWKAHFFLKGGKRQEIKTPRISTFRPIKHLPQFWN